MKYLLLLAVAVAAHGQYGAATSIVSGNGAPVAAQCTNANNVGRVWARKDGGAASTTFYICAATGAGTFGWQLNDGAIGGAGNIASGQVLYGTGAGQAGSEAAFRYDAVNNWLGIGGAPATGLDLAKTETVVGGGLNVSGTLPAVLFNGTSAMYQPSGGGIRFRIGTAMGTNNGTDVFSLFHTTGNFAIGTTTDDGTNRLQVAGSVAGTVTSAVSNQDGATSLRLATSLVGTAVAGTPGSRITFAQRWANTDAGIIRVGAINGWKTASDGAFGGGIQLLHQPNSNVDMAVTLSTFQTGNVAIGTTTDGNFRLDIAASGSSGTLRVYDQTPTTGTTQVIVRAGAGQSATNLQTWQNSSGTAVAGIESTGGFVSESTFFGVRVTSVYRVAMQPTGFNLANDRAMAFSSTSDVNGSKDFSLSRAGINIGQFGDGGSNSNGLLYLKGVRPVGSTVANLPAAAGNTGMMATVTDANATTIGTTVAGGGSDTVLVWSNGTNWRIYAN
jgi:hypothetical protein